VGAKAAIGKSISRASRSMHSSSSSASGQYTTTTLNDKSQRRFAAGAAGAAAVPVVGTPIQTLVSMSDTCTMALLQPCIGVPDVIARCVALLWCAPAIHTQDLFLPLLRRKSVSHCVSLSLCIRVRACVCLCLCPCLCLSRCLGVSASLCLCVWVVVNSISLACISFQTA
jgi:hypothetical protein